jgi:hypothetical protein
VIRQRKRTNLARLALLFMRQNDEIDAGKQVKLLSNKSDRETRKLLLKKKPTRLWTEFSVRK